MQKVLYSVRLSKNSPVLKLYSYVHKFPGGFSGEATPVPIPNTEVKLSYADGTWDAGPW